MDGSNGFVMFLYSFFKKRQQEKQKLGLRDRVGDNESVEDVDDEEFEKILGETEGGEESVSVT